MGHPGYRWTLAPERGGWRWQALDRDGGDVFVQGFAKTRAEAAAEVARAMALGVLGGVCDQAAA